MDKTMVFRTLAGIIVALLLNLAAWALPPVEVAVNPNHPDQYTVVHGDTLWDISGKFLNYPSQWPELWSWNPQIKNPHLIYPGDTLYFSIVNGKPRLSFSPDSETGTLGSGNCVLSEEDIHSGKTNFALAPDNGKLSPCIRQTSNKDAIDIIPSENITKFLSSPRVVGPNDLNLAPYVVDFAGEHMLAATGDKLYVRTILEPETKTYTVYRPGATYKSADTGEILGYEASYVAEGSVEQPGDPATVAIDKAKIEILIGDRLMPKQEEQLVLNYFPRPPEQSIKGSIISVMDGVTQIAKYNVVVLDKGVRDGLLPGHELDIFKRGRTTLDSNSANRNDWVKLPNELAGKLMVFRVFDRVSYALIMKATQAVHVLDKVQTP
jgi:LysM domain